MLWRRFTGKLMIITNRTKMHSLHFYTHTDLFEQVYSALRTNTVHKCVKYGYKLGSNSLYSQINSATLTFVCQIYAQLAMCMFALTHFTFFNAETVQLLILGAVFCGLGFGFSIPLLNHMVVEQSHPQYRGRNLSYFTMAVFLGQFLTSFVEFLPGERSAVYAVAGIAAAIIVCLLIAERKTARPKSVRPKTARPKSARRKISRRDSTEISKAK